ncbi:MAG: hypothetical protein ACE37H_08055 [Phycisphaeraceae bacterium]
MSNEQERIIARISNHGAVGRIRARHDAASMSRSVGDLRVTNAHDFARVTGGYVNHQVKMTGGSGYSDYEARSIAKELLTQHGRRYRRTYNNYIQNAIDGHDGGLRGVLNILTDMLREQQAERFKDDAIDQVIDPLDFDAKVAVTRQILDEQKRLSPGGMGDQRPEAHAHDYQALLSKRAQQIDEMNDELRSH